MSQTTRRRIENLMIVTGDHHLGDPTKLGAAYGPQDHETHAAMVDAIESLGRFKVSVCNDHARLFNALTASPPDLVVNFCDTGVGNQPKRE